MEFNIYVALVKVGLHPFSNSIRYFMFFNFIYFFLFRYFGLEEYEISLANHPLPTASSNELEQQIDTSAALAFIVAYQTFFGICFLVGTFVLFLIKERATKAKHVQVIADKVLLHFII